MTNTQHTQGPWDTTALNQTTPDPVKEEIKHLRTLNAELLEALAGVLWKYVGDETQEHWAVTARAAINKAKGL